MGKLKKSVWGLYILLFFVLLGYQNCVPTVKDSIGTSSISSPTNPSTSPETNPANDPSKDFLLEGGGDGYEGKVYAEIDTRACGNDSDVKTRILVQEDKAQIIRQDCEDLESPLAVEEFSIEGDVLTYDGKSFELESIRGINGTITKDLNLGNYAPGVTYKLLGDATALQAVPLGQDKILIIKGTGRYSAVMSKIEVQLLRQEGHEFTEVQTQEVRYSQAGFYIDPIANMTVLSESKAVFFVKAYKNGESGFQSFIVTTDSDLNLSVVEGLYIPTRGSALSGHPIDEQRFVIAYPSEIYQNYQVVKVDGTEMTLGDPLSAPMEALALTSSALNNPAFLATDDFESFLVMKSASDLVSLPSVFQLTVNDMDLSADSLTIVEGFGIRSRHPMAIGDSQKGAFLIQSAGDFWDEDYSWASVINGDITYQGVLGFGDLTGEWVGQASMLSSRNLMVGDVAFVKMSSLSNERIMYMDPASGVSGLFNIHLDKSWRGGTARLFSVGDRLAFVEIWDGKGVLYFLSVPSREDIQ